MKIKQITTEANIAPQILKDPKMTKMLNIAFRHDSSLPLSQISRLGPRPTDKQIVELWSDMVERSLADTIYGNLARLNKFEPWLLKLYINGVVDYEGINGEGGDTLGAWNALSVRGLLKPQHQDFNKFQSIDQLTRALRDYSEILAKIKDQAALEKHKRDRREIVLIDNERFYVAIPLNYGSCYTFNNAVGVQANFCTGGSSGLMWFKQYSVEGPIIIVFDKANPDKDHGKWQMHTATDQLVDAKQTMRYNLPYNAKRFTSLFPGLLEEIMSVISARAEEIHEASKAIVKDGYDISKEIARLSIVNSHKEDQSGGNVAESRDAERLYQQNLIREVHDRLVDIIEDQSRRYIQGTFGSDEQGYINIKSQNRDGVTVYYNTATGRYKIVSADRKRVLYTMDEQDVDSLVQSLIPTKKSRMTEGSEQISIQVRKGRSKFATELSVDGKPAGAYQYDADSGRSIVEVYPEYKGKGFGKILVLHAIYTAAKLGMDFVEDESRTAEYDNVLDSLDSNGLAVNDDGYWYVTGEGEHFLKQRLKQGVAEENDTKLKLSPPSRKARVRYEDLILDYSIDGATVDVRAIVDDKPVAYVVFLRDGQTLFPDDLAVDEEYRGRSIAKKMYDWVKSLPQGFRIIRGDQTSMGKRFWDKNRGEHVDVWEGVAESFTDDLDNIYAMHPQPEKSEQVVFLITGMTADEFSNRWTNLPDPYQQEFGYDLPLWDADDLSSYPNLVVKRITFDQYVNLVGNYIKSEEQADTLMSKMKRGVAEGSLNEFAPGKGGGNDYLRELASAWYNGIFNTGSLHKGIKSQEDVERVLARGIISADGKTRRYNIDYSPNFDGVVIYSDDYYEHGEAGGKIDNRTGQPWGPYDYIEFAGDELNESVSEGEVIKGRFGQKFVPTLGRTVRTSRYERNPDIDIPMYDPVKHRVWHAGISDPDNREPFDHFEVKASDIGVTTHIIGVAKDGRRISVSTTSSEELAQALVDAYNRGGFTDRDIKKVPLAETAKIKLSTDPDYFGAEVGDYQATGPVHEIMLNKLVGFEPDSKMEDPKSRANVEKITAAIRRGDNVPPILVRKYHDGYQIIDGHHRFHAYKLLKKLSIPAQIVPDKDIEEISKKNQRKEK